MANNVDELDTPRSKRFFVNYVDSYEGRNLARYLSQCVVGASLEEGEEEEEETQSVSSDVIAPEKEGCYEIIGTLKDRTAQKPDFVKEIIDYESKEQLYEHLVECDVIVYDITEDPDQIDEAVWAVSEIHSELDKIERPKMFILISSLMTWAKSTPLDKDDPEIPFTEDDYRRRKPHISFKEHISAEKTVTKFGKTNKSKLVTYVIASGLTYGCGENIFHYLFKAAWHNAEELQVFGNGQNVLPTIHIRDLAGVVQNIADSRPKCRYLVAVDESKSTLEEICKCVSQNLGTGKVRFISKEETLLNKDVQQADFDQLLVNLRMDAVFVKENMRIKWVAETGLVENIQDIIKEYKQSRGLMPMRACVLGPPASGKSTIVKALCNHYKLHHIHMKDVITETMERLEKSAARAEEEDQEDDDGKAQEDQELLDAVNESKEENHGRIADSYIIRFFKERLHSMPCQNQGFILDGYPKTLEQAKELFQAEDDEEAEESGNASYDRAIMPEVVITLEAPDEFLRNRVMNLSETVVADTHNTEEGLARRLAKYKAENTEDETVLNYFDELEFHPVKIDVTKDKSEYMKLTVEVIKKLLGGPRNYGPTAEELKEMHRLAEEARLKREAEEQAERERQEAEEAAERKRRHEEWMAQLEKVKQEECQQLEARSVPLRNYLMKHVMPTLTQGLIDCCKVRPDDAIDHLAEYLFQHNPQVD